MLKTDLLHSLATSGRIITTDVVSVRGNPKLGVLAQLPGRWSNTDGFEGHAWNMIALPFGVPGTLGDFRLLLNQADETLEFDLVDFAVPNRGVNRQDQHLSAVRYLQAINQLAAIDATSLPDGAVQVPATPNSNDTPKGHILQPGPDVPDASIVGIHREPGLLLHLANLVGPCSNQSQPGPDLARVASIPHGDAVLAMGFGGSAPPVPGGPNLTDAALKAAFDPLPIGLGSTDLSNPYFGPYEFFHLKPFNGNVTAPGFPGFDPTNPLSLLNGAIQAALPGAVIKQTTTFSVDSDVNGKIDNIPFVNCQANATKITATFWVQEVEFNQEKRFVLQYAQRVLLEFFKRADGKPGLIQWPHISINTLIRHLP